jgi:hypothetical protein
MSFRRSFLAIPLLALMVASAPAALPTSGTLQDKRLREASGLAPSRLAHGRFWAINDSGNAPTLFALTAQGLALGRVQVSNALNRDWEALGSGPCPADLGGDACLFIADTGDNEANRHDVRIEIVREPALPNVAPIKPIRTLMISFSDGPRDVETLLVHPISGKLYLVDKRKGWANDGPVSVYEVTGAANASIHVARPIVALATTSSDGFTLGRLTDGAFSPDGETLILRDLQRLYQAAWPVTSPALSLTSKPSPPFAQAEALTFTQNGKSVLVTSEGQGSPIVQIDLPQDAAATAAR